MYSIVLWYTIYSYDIDIFACKIKFQTAGFVEFQLAVVVGACGWCIYNIVANPVSIILFKQWYMFNWKENNQHVLLFFFY